MTTRNRDSSTDRPVGLIPDSGAEPTPLPLARLYRLSVEQYHRMAEAGVLGEDDRVELLDGLIVTKMTKNPPHVVATELLQGVLTRLVPVGWFVSMQNPITIEDDDSEPEPDAKVVRGTPRDYRGRRVGARDVALVVEVSDTSYPDDLRKRARYARANIPTYWIVNLHANRLEVYSDPTGPAAAPDYRARRDYPATEAVPLVLDGVGVGAIAVADLLP